MVKVHFDDVETPGRGWVGFSPIVNQGGPGLCPMGVSGKQGMSGGLAYLQAVSTSGTMCVCLMVPSEKFFGHAQDTSNALCSAATVPPGM